MLPEPTDPAAEAATVLLSPETYPRAEQLANLEKIKTLTIALGGEVHEIPAPDVPPRSQSANTD